MAQVSRLSAVLRAVVNAFATVSPTVVVQVCERYATQEGAANRIVLVPDKGPVVGPPKLSAGHLAGSSRGVTAHIWGAASALPANPTEADVLEADLTRSDAADDLLEQLVNALARVAPGRIEYIDEERAEGVNLENFGEVLRLRFRFTRGIAKRPEYLNLAAVALDARPLPPPPPLPTTEPASIAKYEVALAAHETELADRAAEANSPPDPLRTPGAPVLGIKSTVTTEIV